MRWRTSTGIVTSADFFTVLGVPPLLDVGFVPGEDQPDLGRGWPWPRTGSGSAAGAPIRTPGANRSPSMAAASPWSASRSRNFVILSHGPQPDVWVPLHGQMDWDAVKWRSLLPYRGAIARLRPGVSQAQAQSELDVIHARLARLYPVDDPSQHFAVLVSRGVGQRRADAAAGAAGRGRVPCSSPAPTSPISDRPAPRPGGASWPSAGFGAGRGRIARQLLTECLLLGRPRQRAGLLAPGW